MQLLTPLALIGLITIPIILILHLLRDRREQRPVSSLALWQGLQQKRTGTRFRRVPLTLMLLLQLAIATMLAFSLARPVSSYLVTDPMQTIFILDMSSSMLATDISPSRFEAAVQEIRNTLETAAPLDTFALIALKPQPEIIWADETAPNLSDTARAEQKIRNIASLSQLTVGATGINFLSAFHLAASLLDPTRNNRVIILTDGNFKLDPATLPHLPAVVEWRLKLSQVAVGNQALLNVSVKRLPNNSQQLFTRILNYSDQNVERTVQLSLDGQRFAKETVTIAPQGEVARVWNLPAQAQTARLELMEADALPVDNVAELWLQNSTRYHVLLLSDTPDTLARGLQAEANVDLTIATITETRTVTDFNLVVMEGLPLSQLDKFELPTKSLSWLIVNPTAEEIARNVRPDPTLAASWLAELEWSGVYFRQVASDPLPDWAEIDLRAKPKLLDSSQALTETVEAGPPLIYHGTRQNQRVVVWAFNLAESNLPARVTFPLLIDATFATLLAPLPPPTILLGESVTMNNPNFSLALPDGRRLRPSADNPQFNQTQQPGIYKIYLDGTQPVAGFAAQAGSAFESNLTQLFEPPAPSTNNDLLNLQTESHYQEIWPWLTMLVILVMLIEGGLAWRL